jgi:hypothetical protein
VETARKKVYFAQQEVKIQNTKKKNACRLLCLVSSQLYYNQVSKCPTRKEKLGRPRVEGTKGMYAEVIAEEYSRGGQLRTVGTSGAVTLPAEGCAEMAAFA